MKKSILMMGVFALAVMLLPDFALADSATTGSTFIKESLGVFKGNIGTTVGLLFAVLGLYTWLVQQKTTPGLMMIVFGVMLTAFPGLFISMQEGLSGAFSDASDSKAQSNVFK